jgi:hypothetical protein
MQFSETLNVFQRGSFCKDAAVGWSHLRSPQGRCRPPGDPFPDASATSTLTPKASRSPLSASTAFQHPSPNSLQRLETDFHDSPSEPSIRSPNHHSLHAIPRFPLTSQLFSYPYIRTNIPFRSSHSSNTVFFPSCIPSFDKKCNAYTFIEPLRKNVLRS